MPNDAKIILFFDGSLLKILFILFISVQ